LTKTLVAVPKKAGKPKVDKEKIRQLYVRDLNRVTLDRWGPIFPEGDIGALEDLEVLLRYHALHATHGREKMINCIETRAPWLSQEQREIYLSDNLYLDDRYLWLSPNELRERVFLRNADRERLKAWRIPPCDMTPKQLAKHNRDKRNAKQRLNRRKAGVKSRSIYLKDSLSQSEPWKQQGISRATWFRHRKRETGLSKVQNGLQSRAEPTSYRETNQQALITKYLLPQTCLTPTASLTGKEEA
jgi:hypothetical protein